MRFALVFTLWTHPAPATPAPQGGDHWFARDKMLHFAASALIQGSAHAVLRANGADYGRASRGAALVTLSAGISKELWDRQRGGDASLRDLAWDAVGGATAAVGVRQADR